MISNKSYTINIFCKYLVYFNKYSNLIGPNLLPSLYGQNLLDIACRSIIGIFLFPTCPDGTPVSFYVSKDTIQTITPVYFGNGDLVGTSLDSPQANPIPKEKSVQKMVYGLPFLVFTAHVWGNWQRVQTAATDTDLPLMVIWLVSLTITSVWERSPITDNTAKLMLAVGLWSQTTHSLLQSLQKQCFDTRSGTGIHYL